MVQRPVQFRLPDKPADVEYYHVKWPTPQLYNIRYVVLPCCRVYDYLLEPLTYVNRFLCSNQVSNKHSRYWMLRKVYTSPFFLFMGSLSSMFDSYQLQSHVYMYDTLPYVRVCVTCMFDVGQTQVIQSIIFPKIPLGVGFPPPHNFKVSSHRTMGFLELWIPNIYPSMIKLFQ